MLTGGVVLSQITDVYDLEKSKAPLMLIDLKPRQAVTGIEKKVKQYTNDLLEKQLKMDEKRNQKNSGAPTEKYGS
jgi:hypothetical protein